MIQIWRIHHDGWKNILRSHHLHPENAISIFFILEGKEESIVSVIEDHLLEILSSITWNNEEFESDFVYITEKYNQFIQNVDPKDLEGISCLVWLLHGDELSVATLGTTEAILVEDEDMNKISSHDLEKHQFHYISHWKIPRNGTVYLSNISIESILWHSFIVEMWHLSNEEWPDTVLTFVKEERFTNIHVFRISNRIPKTEWSTRIKQKDIIRDTWTYVRAFFQKLGYLKKWQDFLDNAIIQHRRIIQYVILLTWLVLLFFLVYSLVNSLFSVVSNSTWDMKNELLRAQTLITESQKLTNNKTAFNKNIQEAEDILFKLRDDKLRLSDTQELLAKIDVMKKEVNDIQTIDIRDASSLIKFNPTDISPIGVFEYNKKLNLIGTAGWILGYARGENLPKVTPYPTWESAKGFSLSEDGDVFILTNADRVLTARRNEFAYVSVTGENGWEKARSIKIFNNNIYLLSADGKAIFRHRPGINGFSAKTNMLENLSESILDLAIDGWIYLVGESWKIQRYVSWKSEWWPKGLTLNKIPWEYTIWQTSPTKIVSQGNLMYVYILSGNRIWVFRPDSKRFQDINSLTYIAQLEIESDEEIRDIYIPRDGTIYTTTNQWVYETLFEVVDGKILLR